MRGKNEKCPECRKKGVVKNHYYYDVFRHCQYCNKSWWPGAWDVEIDELNMDTYLRGRHANKTGGRD